LPAAAAPPEKRPLIGGLGGDGFDYMTPRTAAGAPTLGRWLSPDPLRGMPGEPQNLNLYAYVIDKSAKFY